MRRGGSRDTPSLAGLEALVSLWLLFHRGSRIPSGWGTYTWRTESRRGAGIRATPRAGKRYPPGTEPSTHGLGRCWGCGGHNTHRAYL